MNAIDVMEIGREGLWVTILVAAPILSAALALGLMIGVLQAATQIQEMTLSFIPKLLGMALALLFFGRWMLSTLVDYTQDLITRIPSLIG